MKCVRRGAGLMTAVALAGCSFATMPEPPMRIRGEPHCTTSRQAPVADLLLALGTVALSGAVLVAGSESEGDADAMLIGTAVIGGIGTLGFLVSSLEGFGRARGCREAREMWIGAGRPPAP